MNYLIVCPKFVNYEDEAYIFPVGIAYIAASLKSVRDTVYTFNLNYKPKYYEVLRETLIDNNIDCIAIGGTSLNYSFIKDIVEFSKFVRPDIITIIGGGLVSASPEVTMEGIDKADIGIIGEGELTIIEVADALEGKKKLSDVDGIIYRSYLMPEKSQSSRIIKNKNRVDIEDLDSIPFPDYDGFEYDKLLKAGSKYGRQHLLGHNNLMTLCTSRSCPYNCTFCFHTSGKKYRKRSLDNVFAELDLLVSKYDFKYLYIVDELFVSDKDRVIEFCDRIKKYNLIWKAAARVDGVTKEILHKMKESGCEIIGYGLESVNNNILKGMKKNIDIESIENAFKLAREAKLNPLGTLLLGDKNETFESFSNSLKWYNDHLEYTIDIAKIIVLPGSQLYSYAVEKENIKDELQYFSDGFPYINITKMTDFEYDKAWELALEATDRKMYLSTSFEIIDIDYENNIFKLSITCKNCKNVFEVYTSDFFAETLHTNLCSDCGQHNQTPVYQYFKVDIEQKLKEYLSQNVLIVYGVGRQLRRWLLASETTKMDNLIIVDKNYNNFEKGIYGKSVYSPDVLKKYAVERVIHGVTGPDNINQISIVIANKYPSISTVQSIKDFLFELLRDGKNKSL